ncbi:MAG: sterol desaturase/sphingolipid hydroxylase (fatty acid hydroxylase superfamily) [Lentimonas sp.]|jgi:sterol desaturase/sphingolipid hydroxylase (fatty acid hydroxylase superfamily)
MENLELVVGNLLLLVFVIIEVFIIKYHLKENLPWKELILNLNSGHILMWILRGLEVAAYFQIASNYSFDLLDNIPYWAEWLMAFFLWDFLFYWLHRTHHYFKILWSVHVVHHEGEHYSLSLGIRNSWYSSLTSIPYFIALAFIGFTVEVFIAVSSIHYFVQFYNHNHLVKKSGWLEYVLITPAHHRVHHGKNDPYLDKNFGGTFVFWDKLFGTFQEEIAENPIEYGVNEPIESYNPVLISNLPFLQLLKPILKFKRRQERIHISVMLIISGAVMLFVFLLFFIYLENDLVTYWKSILFCLIFIGTIGIGVLSDGLRFGAILWSVSSMGVATWVFLFFPYENLLFKIVLITFFLHGAITLYETFVSKSLNKTAL